MFATIRAYLSAAHAMLVTGKLKPAHLSMRPNILTAGHLYALLQRDYADAGATLLRVLILLGAFALLSISPTVYLWRVGVLGTLATLVWAFFLIHDQTARHWFMHRLTLQDAFDNARGRFGGPHDVDSLCLMTMNAGEPIQPDDLIAGEVELADALVEQAHAAEVEARMHQATPPTDTAH